MRIRSLCSVILLILGTVQPCWSQYIRVPVVVRPVVPHVPVHVPHGATGNHGRAGEDNTTNWLIGGAVVLGLGGVGYGVYRWRQSQVPQAVIRIILPPPGEAPESVRQAWVGLLLPVIQGQVDAQQLAAQQVVSGQSVGAPISYAVDGKNAITILSAADPEAGAWWHANAAYALQPGYQLIFPAEVCERLDDLGTQQPK